jgi:hypothetical protein
LAFPSQAPSAWCKNSKRLAGARGAWRPALRATRGVPRPLSGPAWGGLRALRVITALSALHVLHSISFLYGAFVWARRALDGSKRRFPARAVPTELVVYTAAVCRPHQIAFYCSSGSMRSLENLSAFCNAVRVHRSTTPAGRLRLPPALRPAAGRGARGRGGGRAERAGKRHQPPAGVLPHGSTVRVLECQVSAVGPSCGTRPRPTTGARRASRARQRAP